MHGALKNVKKAIAKLLPALCTYSADNKISDTVRLLIPRPSVSKIIGIHGNMIKEIKTQSGGAMIKILSDKEKERDLDETIASIKGTIENKVEAAILITEKIEIFKKSDNAEDGDKGNDRGRKERSEERHDGGRHRSRSREKRDGEYTGERRRRGFDDRESEERRYGREYEEEKRAMDSGDEKHHRRESSPPSPKDYHTSSRHHPKKDHSPSNHEHPRKLEGSIFYILI